MDLQGMVYPALILGGLGLVFGLLLAYASQRFHVETDPRVEQVRALLPGANCGGCGFPGCDGYAEAVVLEGAKPNLCAAGGAELAAGLFVERFYCRYLCPLGAALAIPARIRMFDWLKRYRECGNPCQTCANECPVQAIHPTGEINPNECIDCLHCQVLYQSTSKCPVVIKKLKRREAVAASSARNISGHPNQPKPQPAE